jgi:hypothetical protein
VKPAAKRIALRIPLSLVKAIPKHHQTMKILSSVTTATPTAAKPGSRNITAQVPLIAPTPKRNWSDLSCRRHKDRDHLRRFACTGTGCEAAFSLKADLQRHMNTCRGYRSNSGPLEQFVCQVANCRSKRKAFSAKIISSDTCAKSMGVCL